VLGSATFVSGGTDETLIVGPLVVYTHQYDGGVRDEIKC
jgi:hypothetical protein